MPKDEMSFAELETTDYSRFKTVIDVTMGEFAFSDFYPLHSDSYATCMGVVVGAVDGFGVALGHLDPLADYGKHGSFYTGSLEYMVTRLLVGAKATTCDVCFFKDGYGAFKTFQLGKWLRARFGRAICHIYDGTDGQGQRYDEVVAMPSAFYSAYVCLKAQGTSWNYASGKTTVLQGANANALASTLGRTRELTFQGDGKALKVEGK